MRWEDKWKRKPTGNGVCAYGTVCFNTGKSTSEADFTTPPVISKVSL